MSIAKIGVVGAGMMGAEIALVFALAGKRVLLADRTEDLARRAIDRLASLLEKGVERGLYQPEQKSAALENLTAANSLEPYADRDLVIEAVFEDAAVKGETFATLDRIVHPDGIIASNTSTLSITALSAHVEAARRRRFLGTHFFSPVSRMKLVEVIPGLDTEEAATAQVVAACREAGKEPVRIKDVPGFAVNRLLHAFLIEAVRLVEEGVATPADIDACCKLGLGHPVGPFTLMDIVKNSLSLQVQEILHQAYGPRFLPRPLMKQIVESGRDGRGAGRGWFDYETQKKSG